MLNCERSAIYNDLVFILAAGPFVGNKAEQRCQFTSFEEVISSEVKIFKYTPLPSLNSQKCCLMFISFSFLFNTIAQLCHKMLLVGLFLFVCLVTCATPHFCLFPCLFVCSPVPHLDVLLWELFQLPPVLLSRTSAFNVSLLGICNQPIFIICCQPIFIICC